MTDLAALRSLLAAASPGPWKLEWIEPGEAWIRDRAGHIVASVSLDDAAQDIAAAQNIGAQTLVAAVNAAPALIDEIEALRRVAAAVANMQTCAACADALAAWRKGAVS